MIVSFKQFWTVQTHSRVFGDNDATHKAGLSGENARQCQGRRSYGVNKCTFIRHRFSLDTSIFFKSVCVCVLLFIISQGVVLEAMYIY